MHPCTQISKYIHMKTDSFYKHDKRFTEIKATAKRLYFGYGSFHSSSQRWIRDMMQGSAVRQKLTVLRRQQKATQVLSISASAVDRQTDRQTGCPRLWITKGLTGQQLHFKPLKFSGKSKKLFICWVNFVL